MLARLAQMEEQQTANLKEKDSLPQGLEFESGCMRIFFSFLFL